MRDCKDGNYKYSMKDIPYDTHSEIYEYNKNDVIFIKLYDAMQQVYGSPDYVCGITSALLNSDATIFRRSNYSNGAHLGFILYSTDLDMSEELEDEIAERIRDSKGLWILRSMLGYISGLRQV
ncbi:phage portal protein, partial [Pasteurella multocida]|nr:phage portal protein [Pasteurella multocida]